LKQSPPDSRALVARLVASPHASATIASKRADAARSHPGVVAVILAEDLGFQNQLRPVRPDEPLLARDSVRYRGQPVAVVVAVSEAAAEAAAALLEIDYHPSPAIADLDHALAMQSYLSEAVTIARGDAGTTIGKAPHQIEGAYEIGSQLPFGECPLRAEASPADGRGMQVRIASELPSRVRAAVAQALGEPESGIEILADPLSGLSGGRHSESAHIAALAAIAARRTSRAVVLEIPRSLDLALTAKRHALRADFRAGFDDKGRLHGVDIRLALDGGHESGDSEAALDQALLHVDGAYFVADFRASGRLCRTNHLTGTSLPAEGAAQGAMVIEEILSRIAHRLAKPLDEIRGVNLYRDADNRHSTPYGQPVDCDPLQRIWTDLLKRSDFTTRRLAIEKWNAGNPCYKRGIGVVPVKFGVGDPRSERQQASAQVQLLVDGSVCVRLGCVEVGDGLARRVAEEAGAQFGLPTTQIAVYCGDLHATPHLSPRLGVDAVGLMRKAVADACEALKTRLRPVAAQLLATAGATEIDAESIRFADGRVSGGGRSGVTLGFSQVVDAAWRRRTNLAEVGFHRTPNLWWDREIGAGWPFSGFVYGAAAVEVQLDAFTGEVQVLRADLLQQGSNAAGATQERAQIVKAFQMGLGWMLSESVAWDADGALRSDSAAAYLIPGFGDSPQHLSVGLLASPRQPSEFAAASGAESAVGLAVAAREAVREAIRAFGTPVDPTITVDLPVPATPLAVLEALRDLSRRLSDPAG
jgi:xanthine dehydrogenase large subunit